MDRGKGWGYYPDPIIRPCVSCETLRTRILKLEGYVGKADEDVCGLKADLRAAVELVGKVIAEIEVRRANNLGGSEHLTPLRNWRNRPGVKRVMEGEIKL